MTPRAAHPRSPHHSNNRRRPSRRTLTLAACAAATLAAAAATPGASHADSLVFVKDSNVWLANADGSGQYQVTTDGTAANPYESPSQADDGTIVAVRAHPNLGPIVRMRQNGSVVNEIPVAPMQVGPLEPAISPDGRLVAYEHVFTNTFETSSDVRITNVDGLTAPTVYGHPGSGTGAPSWIDSNRIFVGDYTSAMTQVPGQPASEWWNDWDLEAQLGTSEDLNDGEVAANGTIAFVRGDRDGNTIQLYRSNGFDATPTPTCVLSNPSPGALGARFADPTFSPSGNAIAWQEGDGIWTANLPADNCASAVPRLTIPGASEPDWGPAAVSPGPRQTAPGPDTNVPRGPAPRTDAPRTDAPRTNVPRTNTPRRAPARAGQPVKPRACATLTPTKRDGCTLKAAVTRCNAGPKRRRAACVKSAKRTTAIKACTRKPAKARKRCVAQAKRRYA
jgi:hypothetical protein